MRNVALNMEVSRRVVALSLVAGAKITTKIVEASVLSFNLFLPINSPTQDANCTSLAPKASLLHLLLRNMPQLLTIVLSPTCSLITYLSPICTSTLLS